MLEDPILRDFLVRLAVKITFWLLTVLVKKLVRYFREKKRDQK